VGLLDSDRLWRCRQVSFDPLVEDHRKSMDSKAKRPDPKHPAYQEGFETAEAGKRRNANPHGPSGSSGEMGNIPRR
jgi:hypothetical protein